MAGLFFADLPIYRLPRDQYYESRAQYVDRFMYSNDEAFRAERMAFYERHGDEKISTIDRLQKEYGGPWNFNETVGYVRLHFLGSQVRGELWMVKVSRMVRTRKKMILFRSHKIVSEVFIPGEATSGVIWQKVLEYVERARSELAPRYLDSSLLEAIGVHVDWRSLLDSQRPVSQRESR